MSSSVHIDNKRRDILILGKWLAQGLDGTTFTAEALYPSFSFTQSRKIFALSLHYNGSNSFLFVNATNVYQFKAKNSEIKNYIHCLGIVSKDFTINNMKKTGWKGVVKYFSVAFNPIDTNDIIDIHKYLMERTWYKINVWSY